MAREYSNQVDLKRDVFKTAIENIDLQFFEWVLGCQSPEPASAGEAESKGIDSSAAEPPAKEHAQKIRDLINQPDDQGNTLLHVAFKCENLGMVLILKHLDADFNRTNNAGKQPAELYTGDQEGNTLVALFKNYSSFTMSGQTTPENYQALYQAINDIFNRSPELAKTVLKDDQTLAAVVARMAAQKDHTALALTLADLPFRRGTIDTAAPAAFLKQHPQYCQDTPAGQKPQPLSLAEIAHRNNRPVTAYLLAIRHLPSPEASDAYSDDMVQQSTAAAQRLFDALFPSNGPIYETPDEVPEELKNSCLWPHAIAQYTRNGSDDHDLGMIAMETNNRDWMRFYLEHRIILNDNAITMHSATLKIDIDSHPTETSDVSAITEHKTTRTVTEEDITQTIMDRAIEKSRGDILWANKADLTGDYAMNLSVIELLASYLFYSSNQPLCSLKTFKTLDDTLQQSLFTLNQNKLIGYLIDKRQTQWLKHCQSQPSTPYPNALQKKFTTYATGGDLEGVLFILDKLGYQPQQQDHPYLLFNLVIQGLNATGPKKKQYAQIALRLSKLYSDSTGLLSYTLSDNWLQLVSPLLFPQKLDEPYTDLNYHELHSDLQNKIRKHPEAMQMACSRNNLKLLKFLADTPHPSSRTVQKNLRNWIQKNQGYSKLAAAFYARKLIGLLQQLPEGQSKVSPAQRWYQSAWLLPLMGIVALRVPLDNPDAFEFLDLSNSTTHDIWITVGVGLIVFACFFALKYQLKYHFQKILYDVCHKETYTGQTIGGPAPAVQFQPPTATPGAPQVLGAASAAPAAPAATHSSRM